METEHERDLRERKEFIKRHKEYSAKGGRNKAHKPTDALRGAVQLMKFGGFTDKDIAEQLKISVSTLRKYYAEEMQIGQKKILGSLLRKDVEVALDTNHKDSQKSRHFLMERIGKYIKSSEVNLTGDLTVVMPDELDI